MLREMAKTITSRLWRNQTICFYTTFPVFRLRPDRQKRFACSGKPMTVMKRNGRRGQTLQPLIKTLLITFPAPFLSSNNTLFPFNCLFHTCYHLHFSEKLSIIKSTSVLKTRARLKSETKLSLVINTPPFVSGLSFSFKSCPQTLSNLGHLPAVSLPS